MLTTIAYVEGQMCRFEVLKNREVVLMVYEEMPERSLLTPPSPPPFNPIRLPIQGPSVSPEN